jgi:hypothetical protein
LLLLDHPQQQHWVVRLLVAIPRRARTINHNTIILLQLNNSYDGKKN